MMLMFPLVMEPDDNGALLVTCPILPEVTSFGETRADAVRYGREAIEEAIGARMSRWRDISLPDGREQRDAKSAVVRLSLQTEMKFLLFRACKAAGVTRADLVRALGWRREQVDRLFRLDHASRIDQLDAAMTALGKTFDLGVKQAA